MLFLRNSTRNEILGMHLRHHVKCVKQQLQDLPGGGSLGALLQPILQRHKRRLHAAPEPLDLLPELNQRSSHPDDSGIDIDELGAQVNEVIVIAVDEVNEFVIEGGEVGLELGAEGVEGDECTEFGDVGFGVEVVSEEGGGLEPEGVGVERIGEQISRGSGWQSGRRRGDRIHRSHQLPSRSSLRAALHRDRGRKEVLPQCPWKRRKCNKFLPRPITGPVHIYLRAKAGEKQPSTPPHRVKNVNLL